jgi:hypothetical protein
MSPAATTDITYKTIMFFQRKLFVTKKRTRDGLSPNTISTNALADGELCQGSVSCCQLILLSALSLLELVSLQIHA